MLTTTYDVSDDDTSVLLDFDTDGTVTPLTTWAAAANLQAGYQRLTGRHARIDLHGSPRNVPREAAAVASRTVS